MREVVLWMGMLAITSGCAPTGSVESSGGNPGLGSDSSGASSGGGSSTGGAGSSSGTTSSGGGSGGSSGSSSGGFGTSVGIFGLNAPRCVSEYTLGDTLHSRDVYHNHPDGRPDWMETQNGQGVVRSTRHYIYDADDRLTGSEDREADGTPKSRVAYYFTPQRVLERTDRDTDADGDVDKRTTHIYDAEGHRIEDRTDTDMDGTADDTITYANNGLGNPETVTTTTSGGAVTIDHYQYDDVNRVSVIRVDFFGDETINRVVSYLYDAAGRLSAMEGDEDLDGTLDWRWTISYDC